MTVSVQYFAVLRDRRGLASETIEWAGGTVRELVDVLLKRHVLGLSPALIRVALNGAFVDDACALSDGDHVLLVPPVAGG